MRTDIFHMELEVELPEDERNLRGRQAARITLALEARQAKAKEMKKKLAEDEKKLEDSLLEVSRAAETGREKRQVKCREELRGAMVEIIRLDTMATVDSRKATKEDLGDKPPMVPGGGARKTKKGDGDEGVVPDDYVPKH